ncbi:HD-GYP domain-containing protein [Lapillicoccus jejuensis]|uniref:HD domain-containing protein n=1 Tax=Lapillicoccus jejuensis TaxID=402171 RepID=A0A542DVY4_9MICO|nr:HD domain-containing phosphohydrolase [Lapillicoccus jejuensis]TQJ07269.1 HD domain-containing protein [Lapillicoccus jejuensis]
MPADPRATDRGRRRRVQVVVGLTCLVAVVGFAVNLAVVGPPKDLVALGVLAALAVLSHFLRGQGLGFNVTLSFLSIILLACIPTVGPVGASLVGALVYVVEPQRSALRTRVFNTAMAATLGWVGGAAYLLLGGTLTIPLQGAWPLVLHVALPLLAADIVQMTVNALLIAAVLRADAAQPVRVTFFSMVSSSGLAYFGYGAISFLFVTLWFPARVGPFSAVLILAPLFVAQWVINQYVEEVRAHESALSGLVTAAEIKDPASRGHSERVARLAEWMGETLSLSTSQAASLRFAAQLHDIGKVALPTLVVRRGANVGRDDLEVLKRHAEQGVLLLSGIDFLETSLTAIRHHHERWDGRGYPDGLAGEDIPLSSRVIAVADAYDALTTRRPERPSLGTSRAFEAVAARAGTQFDPRIVEALRNALERHRWVPAEVSEDELLMMDGYLDHDDPAASDLMASRIDPQPGPVVTPEQVRS